MNDPQMKEMLGKLKDQYDQMPIKSSPEDIMSKVNKEKRPRWGIFFHKWQVAALIIFALGVGGVLTISQTNELSSDSQNDESAEFAAGIDESSEAPALTSDSLEIAEEESEDSSEAADSSQDNEASVETEIITIEGTEEEIQVKSVEDERLGFSTKVDERYIIEEGMQGEEEFLQIFANYTGTPVDAPFFSVTKHTQSTQEIEQSLRERYASMGYEERESSDFFTQHESELNFVSELSFEVTDSIVYVGIVEANGIYYDITVDFIGEMYERIGADTVVLLKHAQFQK